MRILRWIEQKAKELELQAAQQKKKKKHKILAKFLYFLISIDWAASQMARSGKNIVPFGVNA